MSILEEARQLVQPSSPRYARYDERVRFLGRLLTFLHRNRVFVTLLCGAVLALLLVFLSLIGSFFSEAQCRDFVYGDVPACNARAFLSHTEFQYTDLHAVLPWQQTIPSTPGQYRIRGTAKNVFGTETYSNEMIFTLLPRDLHLVLPNDSILYGQLDEYYLLEHILFEGLVSGDRIRTANWDIQLECGPVARIQLTQLRIEDTQGRDVTACYRIHDSIASIPLQKRPITVTAESFTKVYDGIPYQPSSYKLSSGTLAFGDTLEVSFETRPENAGSYPLLPECTIRNSAGEDISQYYHITTEAGLLTVQPRPLTIATGSAEKVYDGKPLTNSQWTLDSGSLLDGHTLQVSFPVKLTVAGTAMNEPDVQILDGSGKEIQDNYAITITPGTLTVTPIILKFDTGSGEKVYDGTPLRVSGYRHLEGTPIPGHRVKVLVTGEQLFAGSGKNNMDVSVTAADGTDVTTQGYQIEVIPGTLTVTRRAITLTSGSAEKLYDSFPLTHQKLSVTSGSICQQEGINWWDFTGSQTEVGSSSNTFSVKISSGRLGGVDVTSSYEIRYQYGILTVKPNPNFIPHPGPGGSTSSIPGPATPGKDSSIAFPRGSNNTVYATVHSFDKGLGTQQIYFRGASYGDYTGSGWTAPKVYVTEYLSPLEFAGAALYESAESSYIEIQLLNDCPVLFPNYSKVFYRLNNPPLNNDSYYHALPIIYGMYWMDDPGYYDIAQKALTGKEALLEQEYQKHVYATYLDVPLATRDALIKWANRHGIHPSSPTLVTDIQTAVQNAASYNRDAQDYPPGADVAVHFLTEAKEGICQHFATAATLLYRCFNIPARYTTGFLSTVTGGTTTKITGNDAHAWVEVYQRGVGWISLEVTGSRTVEPSTTNLVIKAASATKQYDGLPFNDQQLKQFTLESGELLPGHHLEVTFSHNSNAIHPGSYQNTITSYRILDDSGKDVTASYSSIRVIPGQLQILKRTITVASGSAVKTADGTALTCGDYWLAQGSLAKGDQLDVEITGSITDPGTKENQINRVTVYRTDPLGQPIIVNDYYTIYMLPGKLTIYQATPE